MKTFKRLVYWAYDPIYVLKRPSADGTHLQLFLVKPMTAGEMAKVSRCLKEQSDVKAKESTPGPLVWKINGLTGSLSLRITYQSLSVWT